MALVAIPGPYKTPNAQTENLPVKASAVIAVYDYVMLTAGFIEPAGAGDAIYGVAMEAVTGGATSGDRSCAVDTNPTSRYARALSAGTLVEAMRGKTCDLGGAQTVDVTASLVDNVRIVDCDVANQLAICEVIRQDAGGVV